VLEPVERDQPAVDRLVNRLTVEAADKRDAATVMEVRGIVNAAETGLPGGLIEAHHGPGGGARGGSTGYEYVRFSGGATGKTSCGAKMVRHEGVLRVEKPRIAFVPWDNDPRGSSACGAGIGATLLIPMDAAPNPSSRLDSLDESRNPDGTPRGAYAELFETVDIDTFAIAREQIERELAQAGVVFGGAETTPFDVDPVPRLVESEEWAWIERGLGQRIRALNAFLADVYGGGRILAAGVVPRELLDTADWYEPAMSEPGMPAVRAHVAGPDLVRGADGELRVLEDNLRAPSGLAYALAARRAMAPLISASGLEPRPLDGGVTALGEMLRAAAPAGGPEPNVVALNDGQDSSALYEHRELARLLGLRMATAADLRRRGDTLLVGEGEGERAVDVIYRRVDDERLTAADGTATTLGELLIEPLRAGTIACVNSPGSGVADDKAVHTYVERMIDFYLGEPALMHSVPGRYLGEPGELERALPRLGELVIKPRSQFGGKGVVIGALASDRDLSEAAELLQRDPDRFVVQETVALSLHPTLIDGSLDGRHVDLRPFVISNEESVKVVPGGLSRFAREAGVMVVNSGRGGGAKDTWVL